MVIFDANFVDMWHMIRFSAIVQLALNNGPLAFTYENMSDAVLKRNHLLHRRGLNLQEIVSKEDSADINGGKTGICWNFASLISRKLIIK